MEQMPSVVSKAAPESDILGKKICFGCSSLRLRTNYSSNMCLVFSTDTKADCSTLGDGMYGYLDPRYGQRKLESTAPGCFLLHGDGEYAYVLFTIWETKKLNRAF